MNITFGNNALNPEMEALRTSFVSRLTEAQEYAFKQPDKHYDEVWAADETNITMHKAAILEATARTLNSVWA